ncbi:hypothetical protein RB195_018074 [Necator americanus]|uniref:Metalloendopeptidase n=1 Tax=Necator americanus TaxID=51031 RepID=A0ABR1CAG2_NECAM
MRELEWDHMGVKVGGRQLHHLRFACDIVLITRSSSQAERMLTELGKTCEGIGLHVNLQKTTFMRNGRRNIYVDMLGENSPFADPSSIDRHLSNMEKLNTLQSKIMGIRPTSHDQINFDADPASPDQLPYLFEGDMILTESQMDSILSNTEDQLWAKQGGHIRPRRSMTSSLYARWTTFPIPYYINVASGVSEPAVLAGVARWETDTCLTFERQYSRANGNGLEFFLGSGCYSMVGRVGYSSQQISIGYGCTSLGTVTHEIGHALGFFHEQGRYDRDAYVSIDSQNIQNGYLSQFTKQSRSSMEDYGVGYDYGSVMHYDQFNFNEDRENLIDWSVVGLCLRHHN